MIAITGATGHVGNVLVRELVSRGARVRAVIPPFEDAHCIDDLEVERVCADVRKPDTLLAAFQGIEVVYHLAGIVSISSGHAALLHEVNVVGTRNVVRACLESGVRRLVYTSSVHALTEPPHGIPVCEGGEIEPDRLIGDYARSKARASIEVLKGVAQGLDAVLVFPSGVIGPFDFRLSEMGQLLLDIATGRLKAYIDGAYDFVDVRDVVAGLISAAENGRRGEGYILSGDRVTVAGLLTTVRDIVGRGARPRRVPYWLARVAATFAPVYYGLARRKPRFTSYSLRVLRSNCLMNREKAGRELGYAPRPIKESVADCIRWFAETGRLQTACPKSRN